VCCRKNPGFFANTRIVEDSTVILDLVDEALNCSAVHDTGADRQLRLSTRFERGGITASIRTPRPRDQRSSESMAFIGDQYLASLQLTPLLAGCHGARRRQAQAQRGYQEHQRRCECSREPTAAATTGLVNLPAVLFGAPAACMDERGR